MDVRCPELGCGLFSSQIRVRSSSSLLVMVETLFDALKERFNTGSHKKKKGGGGRGKERGREREKERGRAEGKRGGFHCAPCSKVLLTHTHTRSIIAQNSLNRGACDWTNICKKREDVVGT